MLRIDQESCRLSSCRPCWRRSWPTACCVKNDHGYASPVTLIRSSCVAARIYVTTLPPRAFRSPARSSGAPSRSSAVLRYILVHLGLVAICSSPLGCSILIWQPLGCVRSAGEYRVSAPPGGLGRVGSGGHLYENSSPHANREAPSPRPRAHSSGRRAAATPSRRRRTAPRGALLRVGARFEQQLCRVQIVLRNGPEQRCA